LVLAIGVAASLPAFVGTSPIIYEPIAALCISEVIVQTGFFVFTLLLVVVIARTAFRTAVQRFQEYQLG
jgi:hypothetical protein